MNLNMFIAHSNKFMMLTKWFSEFLKSRGLNPIVMELTPNAGRVWSVAEKENHLLSLCETALVIATPDERQDNSWVPRLDVSFEIGRLKETKKAIILKELTVKLPRSLEPVFIPFILREPNRCLKDLDEELVSIFGDKVSTKTPFKKRSPRFGRNPTFSLEGKNLSPENSVEIEQEIERLFMSKPKTEQISIVKNIVESLNEKDEEKRWIAARLIEEIVDYDSRLVPMDAIIRMSQDHSFSVRSSAAVCLYKFSNVSPGTVPLDLVVKLASPREDWYVFNPARAALKTLAHRNFSALRVLIKLASSKKTEIAEDYARDLLEVIKNDPEVVQVDSLKKLATHESKRVREYSKEMTRLIKDQSTVVSNLIRYSPF